MPRASIVIRTLFALCLLGATVNHGLAIVRHGWLWDYGLGIDVPLFSRLYWDTLTFVDPLAAILLFARPRAGVGLTVGVIVSDVLHNTYYVARLGLWLAPFYLAQVAFLVAVLGLAHVALRGSRARRETGACRV